ncbi:putative cystathionine gamma-synthase 2 [Hibiscus syriacus]|uniref:Cystathionine gamma-synthase 2 n=1 Tax=Hibiscus syriacus TaxID=106335 RepID=A0A6A2XSE6_HIBSY|nr:putative cystathionine gamma-synthase 2 [Hibiscus syriacus]
MAAPVSSCSFLPWVFNAHSSYECRSDPDFSGAPTGDKPHLRSNRRVTPSFFFSTGGGGLSSPILRFPPNFVRQLSVRDRRNCSNIGVAQVVAASWSNGSSSRYPASAVAAASQAAAASRPVSDDVAVVDGCIDNGGVQIGDLCDSKTSFLSSDGSIIVHAGEILDRGIVTDAVTTPVVNTSAYFFKKTQELIDFKVDQAELFFLARFRLASWYLAKYKQVSISKDLLISDPSLGDSYSPNSKPIATVINWSPPPKGFIKLNVDAATTTDWKRSGIGGVLRDDNGTIIDTYKESAGPGPLTLMELKSIFNALEGDESTLIMASGMCASTVMLMALVSAGGHIVATTDCYRKTRIFIETILPKMGISKSDGLDPCYWGKYFIIVYSLSLLIAFDN